MSTVGAQRHRAAAGYSAAVLADSPFAFFKLGESSGSFADSSTSGFTGVIAGTGSTRAIATGFAGAPAGIQTNGTGYADLGLISSFGSSMSSPFSIEFLYKDNNATSAQTALGTVNTGSTTALIVGVNFNHLLAPTIGSTTFFIRNEAGASRAVEIGTNIYDAAWHHLIWSCTPGGTDVVYVDGASVTPLNVDTPTVGTFLNFGFDLFAGGRNNRGSALVGNCSISNLALYKAALSSTRVTAHYAAINTL